MQTLAGVIFILGFLPYIAEIFKTKKPFGWRGWNILDRVPFFSNKVEPSKMTWIIWAVLDSITLTGMYLEKSDNKGQMIGAVSGAWVVVVLALIYGKSGWTKTDKFCLAGAVLGIAVMIFSEPLLGMVISLSVVALGSLPTFQSAWKDPASESKIAWTIWWLSCIFALIAVPQWTVANALQPTVFFTIETIVCLIVYLKPRKVAVLPAVVVESDQQESLA